jgi:hypothetical protein
MYYLDCFIESEKSFPVNSYYDADPKSLAEVGADLLLRKMSGITSITISKDTKGVSPIRLIHKVIERPIR